MRIKLEKVHDGDSALLELFMGEICRMATENWSNSDNRLPDLTAEQLDKVIIRVLSKNYNEN
jgi:hypothetical protein